MYVTVNILDVIDDVNACFSFFDKVCLGKFCVPYLI